MNWFSTYHVHHRVANHFQQGRAFLLGDAAHIHSPVGGQGMNTGIGDAVNLAWKLAAVLQGRAASVALHTYEPERIAFARRLVATTDRAFTVVTQPRPRRAICPCRGRAPSAPGAVRSEVRPPLHVPDDLADRGELPRQPARATALAGSVKGGDRLPWVTSDSGPAAPSDNFAPLSSLDWQVHVYGECGAGIVEVCSRRGLALHVFEWHPATARAGLKRGAVYLVRPDGHIGLADPDANPAKLEQYLDIPACSS